MKKTLRPIQDKDSYSDFVEKAIDYALFQLIYKPLLEILEPSTRENARSMTLVKAFETGRLWYSEGFVYGSFNATLSKELRSIGGRYLPSKKGFKIPLSNLPPEVRSSIAHGEQIAKEKIAKLKKAASELKDSEAVFIKFESSLEQTLSDLEKQFHKVTPEDLEIPVVMDGHLKEALKKKFEDNVHSYTFGWSEEAIDRLRTKVATVASQGFRADAMQKVIMAEYGVTKQRAKLIARQEMSNFVSKYRQTRYETAGINKYIWSTSQDERVRDDHKELNGREFSFDQPPIVDKATGRRGNPGEDFGCRCVALPVINFAGVESE